MCLMYMNARLVQADQSVSDAYECKVGPGRSECV